MKLEHSDQHRKSEHSSVSNPDLHMKSALDANVWERVRLYFRVPVAMVVEAPPFHLSAVMFGHSETDLTESDSAKSSNLNFTFHLQVINLFFLATPLYLPRINIVGVCMLP